jgi:hypothetical protein
VSNLAENKGVRGRKRYGSANVVIDWTFRSAQRTNGGRISVQRETAGVAGSTLVQDISVLSPFFSEALFSSQNFLFLTRLKRFISQITGKLCS